MSPYRKRQLRRAKRRLRMVQGVFLLSGVALYVLAVSTHITAISTTGWQQTSGTVLQSYVYRTGTGPLGAGGPSKIDSAQVRYEYWVAGKRLTGSRTHFGNHFHHWLIADRITASYRTGQQVQVYYDPERPHRAVLDPSYPGFAIIFLLAAGSLLIPLGLFLRPLMAKALHAIRWRH